MSENGNLIPAVFLDRDGVLIHDRDYLSSPEQVELIAGAVPELGSLVDNLVKGREDVISELHLGDCCCTGSSGTNSETSDTLLGQGSAEDTIGTVLLIKAHCATENSTELDILSEDQSTVVSFHGQVKGVSDSRPKVHILELRWVAELELLSVKRV